MSNFAKNKKGFVVLYTVLIAAIILAITIGISSISFGEIVLSAEAREGNIAFLAADTGAECALYYDRVLMQPSPAFFSCDGNFGLPSLNPNLPPGSFLFNLNPDQSGNFEQCVAISVNKNFTGTAACVGGCTRIESRGYNVPCSAVTLSPRVIERAVRVTYANAVGPTPLPATTFFTPFQVSPSLPVGPLPPPPPPPPPPPLFPTF